MEWTGSAKAVFCLLIFLQLSCHQCMADEVPLTICVDQDLTFTADSNLHLFIDGVEVSLQYSSFPGNADTTLLPASAKVIAVSGQNEVVNGGFLGSSGTFVTDASWKCTDQHHDGWQGVGFDDSAWQQAYEVRLHGDSPWYVVEGIRLDARWIWIKPEGCIPEGIINVYCRKRLADTCIAPPIQCSTPAPTTTTTTPVPTTTTTTTPVPTTTTTTPVPTTTTTTPVPTTTTTTPVPTTTTTTPVPTTTTTTPVPTTTTTTPVPTTTTTTTPVPTTTTTTTTTTTPAPTTTTKPPLSCQPQPTPPPGCSGTGPTCITSCTGLGDGDYQSCRGCNVYATCSNGYLTDGRPCAACLFWDDNVKRCEYTSTTCAECPGTLCSGTGAACIGSCRGRADGDYQSCKGWDVYATCSNGRMNDRRPCAAGRPAM